MTMNRRPRVTRRQSERLLDGELREGPVAALLGAARRPGDPRRPALGEEAARAAFRSASACPDIRRAPAPRPGVRRLVAVKVLAAAVVVTGVGGAAVAATSTGVDRLRVVAQPTALPTGVATSPTAVPTPIRTSAAAPAAPRKGPVLTPRPAPTRHRAARQHKLQLALACRIWPQWQWALEQHAAATREFAQQGHRLRPLRVPEPIALLLRAAGGERAVPAFCRTISLPRGR
jgi:hypothetical protein